MAIVQNKELGYVSCLVTDQVFSILVIYQKTEALRFSLASLRFNGSQSDEAIKKNEILSYLLFKMCVVMTQIYFKS